MVCDQTDGNVMIIYFAVFFAGDLADKIAQGTDGIHVKNGIHILNNHSQSLQAHTGIDILLFQFCIISVSVVLELGKHVVPYFHITVAVASYRTVRFAAAVFLSAVIIDLGTGAAGTCAVLPEVILFSKTEDTFRRNADLFVPYFKRLVVVQIDRRIQPVRIQPHYFCKEFPGPVKRFSLEVIAKREVAQHLKKRTVARGFSYVFNIAGTDTFLAGGHSRSRRDLRACKIRFQRSHTCVDQKKALISLRDQGIAFVHKMSLAFHEIQEHLAQFVNAVFFHCFFLQSISPALCGIFSFRVSEQDRFPGYPLWKPYI